AGAGGGKPGTAVRGTGSARVLAARDRLLLAGGLAGGEPPIGKLADRRGGEAGKAPGDGDRRLERQLRRKAELDLGALRHGAGLVVDDDEGAIPAAIDAIGLAGKLERAGGTADDEP